VIAAVAVAAALTRPQYQVLLDRANARVSKAEAAAQNGLTPKATRADVERLMGKMAHAEAANSAMFAAASPPADVASVNGHIVRAERLYAAELRDIVHRVHIAKSRAEILKILQGPGPHPGPQLLDRAIVQLHKLGYR
jgi:hypothetical protein